MGNIVKTQPDRLTKIQCKSTETVVKWTWQMAGRDLNTVALSHCLFLFADICK